MYRFVRFSPTKEVHARTILEHWLITMNQTMRKVKHRLCPYEYTLIFPRSYFLESERRALMKTTMFVEWLHQNEEFPVISKMIFTTELGYEDPNRVEIVFSDGFLDVCHRLDKETLWRCIAKLQKVDWSVEVPVPIAIEMVKMHFSQLWADYLVTHES